MVIGDRYSAYCIKCKLKNAIIEYMAAAMSDEKYKKQENNYINYFKSEENRKQEEAYIGFFKSNKKEN